MAQRQRPPEARNLPPPARYGGNGALLGVTIAGALRPQTPWAVEDSNLRPLERRG